MNISHFTPDESVKECIVYLNGQWPPKNTFYVEKDLNLPARLYPNAKIYVRCNTFRNFIQTSDFFRKLYKGREVKFINDNLILAMKPNPDTVIWFIHFNFIFFGGKIDKYTYCKWQIIQKAKCKVHILFNEEGTPSFEPLYDYIQRRNDNFKELNKDILKTIGDKTDWTNITLLCNEDKLKQWVNDRPIKKCLDGGINISYLTDKILYDLPDYKTLSPKIGSKKGIYIGKFSPKRITFFNKFFSSDLVDIECIGPDSDKIKCHKGNGENVDNKTAKEMLSSSNYGYSIYIGKGTPSLYLGATFYEPLLNGLPIFIWEGTDPEHKLLPKNPEYYFKDETDLNEKLKTMSVLNLIAMYNYQITQLL